MLTVGDVLTALTQRNAITDARPIGQVVIDSRQVQPGDLFIALPGEKVDGHQFVNQAFAAGASIALIHQPVDVPDGITLTTTDTTIPADLSRPLCLQVDDTLIGLQQLATYWRQQFSPQIIGITGSVGKTSTKELTYLVLAQKYHTLKNQGNLNNEIGLPLTLLTLNKGHKQVVLEMGMYDVGEIKTLCTIAKPQIGVITNIGPTHLERLGTMERIVTAKQELVEALPADGVAILNVDDPLVSPMRHHTPARVFTYGLAAEADLRAEDIASAGLEGIRFTLSHAKERFHVKVPLLGRHSVHTALRAAAVGLTQGLDWSEIVTGLQDKKAQLRLVAVPGPNGAIILDDTYNASPKSALAALNLLKALKATRKIAVLGDMAELGSYEAEGHRKVGCRAAQIVDILVTVGPKSRLTASEAIACGLTKEVVTSFDEPEPVLPYLKEITATGDIILIKGSRSMAMETVVAGLMTNSAQKVTG